MHQLHQEGAIRNKMSTMVRHAGRVKGEERRFARKVSSGLAQAHLAGLGAPHVKPTCSRPIPFLARLRLSFSRAQMTQAAQIGMKVDAMDAIARDREQERREW